MNKKAFSQTSFLAVTTLSILIISGCQTNLSGTDLSGNLGQVINNNLTPEQQKIATLENQNQNLQDDLALKNTLLEELQKKNYQLLRESNPNIFDYKYIKEGDRIGEMTVTSLTVPEKEGYGMEKATFSGNVTVTGQYTYHSQDNVFHSEEVCLELSKESIAKIPLHVYYADLENPYFCFSNKELADKLFANSPTTGTVTVEISEYYAIFCECEAWPTAKLERIIK